MIWAVALGDFDITVGSPSSVCANAFASVGAAPPVRAATPPPKLNAPRGLSVSGCQWVIECRTVSKPMRTSCEDLMIERFVVNV